MFKILKEIYLLVLQVCSGLKSCFCWKLRELSICPHLYDTLICLIMLTLGMLILHAQVKSALNFPKYLLHHLLWSQVKM